MDLRLKIESCSLRAHRSCLELHQQGHLLADAQAPQRVDLPGEGAEITHTVTLIVLGATGGQGEGHALTFLVASPLAAPRGAQPMQRCHR